MLLQGDCLEQLKEIESGSVDCLVTDPPYGYSFMGKDWDKAVVGVETWRECLRVLKAGAFAFVMSAPRQDVLSRMICNLTDAGFKTDFTSLYWTYASGFPKAGNIGKMVDKRLGVKRERIKVQEAAKDSPDYGKYSGEIDDNNPITDQAKALDGSYAGFQPKPAVEVIIVCMKPLSEKTYVDQALKNGKGISWLDDCRVPCGDKAKFPAGVVSETESVYGGGKGRYADNERQQDNQPSGRFPANLLVSDDVLNDGVVSKSPKTYKRNTKSGNKNAYGKGIGEDAGKESLNFGDSGSYSRYFDLDAWNEKHNKSGGCTHYYRLVPTNRMAECSVWQCDLCKEFRPDEESSTLPFLITPKASKREKNEGLEGGTGSNTYNRKCLSCGKWERQQGLDPERYTCKCEHSNWEKPKGNFHPTCKPLKLMSYLITLGSREGDTVLEPFMGSGTTGVAAKKLNRQFIGIEREEEYMDIAKARIDNQTV